MSSTTDSAPAASESSALGSTPFRVGLALAFLLLATMAFKVASLESFSRDDFSFLYHVQEASWNWRDAFLPLKERWWWAYRPLGMEAYFYLCLKAFGLNPLGFFSVSLAIFFSTGLLVFRVARQFGFAGPVAAVTGLLAISRNPTLSEIYYGSDFHYVGAVFFGLISTTLLLDHLRRGGVGRLVLSCVSFVAALLCNEFSLILSVFFGFVSLWVSLTDEDGNLRPRTAPGPLLLRAALQTAPYLVLAGLYLILRFRIIGPAMLDVSYATRFSVGQLISGMKAQTFFVFGDAPTLLIASSIVVAISVAIARHPQRSAVLHWLLPTALVFVFWTIGGMAPFLVLVRQGARFATAIEVPMCLLFGSFLAALWRLHGLDGRRRLELALLLLVFAALPYRTLWERSQTLYGNAGKNLIAALKENHPHPERLEKLVVLYNAPGLASSGAGRIFKSHTFGVASAVWAYYPDEPMQVVFHDLGYMGARRDCSRCAHLQLLPDFKVQAAEDRYFGVKPPTREERRQWVQEKRRQLIEKANERRESEGR